MFDDKNTLEGSLISCIPFFFLHMARRSLRVFFFPPVAMCSWRWRWRALQDFRGNHSTLWLFFFFTITIVWLRFKSTLGLAERHRKTEIIQCEFTKKICDKKKKTRRKINVVTWTSTADGVLVRTDETFCSDWPDAGRSCPFFLFFFFQRAACIYFFPVEAENTNARSVNSGTVALLWPPAEPGRLEAAQHDVGLAVRLDVSDRSDSCCGFN